MNPRQAQGSRPLGLLALKPLLLGLGLVFLSASWAPAGPLDEMSVERWAKLREAERFQLNAAEKFYRDNQWKVAADEYEKFLKLYERSEGAAYAQLKYSHCLTRLRKQNTAIKDGYQTLLDYFPESPEAPVASLMIGRTYDAMGDTKAAKKAYLKTVSTYPKHFVSAMARLDLVDIAAKEKDTPRRAALLRELTYEVDRKGPTARECAEAARLYSQHCFTTGDFDEGLKALATESTPDNLPPHLMHPQHGRLPQIVHELTGSMDGPTKQKGEKVADAAVAWFKAQAAEDVKDAKKKDRGVACWYAAADIQGSARRPEKQREIYDQMLAALGPNDALLGRLAQWFKDAKQRDKARETYLKFADKAEGESQIAWSYIEENKFDPAVEIYRKLAATSDAKTAPKWLSQAAYTYRRASKPDQAIAIYRDLLSSDAGNAGAWHWEIAETLYHAGRWKECITAYRGTDRFPDSYNKMAHANRQLKQFDEAISLYTQIIAASPPHASAALLQIGYTHEQAGRSEPAIKVFKQVCDKFPKSGEGSAAHAHLNQKYKITVTLGGAKD